VLFADIVGFTVLSQQMSPKKLVSMLNDIFSAFDRLVAQHRLEKIKTIGDAYMVAAGIPDQQGNHAVLMADFALDMRDAMTEFSRENGLDITVRIGINSGPAVAGVIGEHKFIYDIWGDTVNTASRMESHGRPGEIHVSNLTRELLGNAYRFEDCGEIPVKGKGNMRTWILTGVSGQLK
jgi:class 3 adenylate cyclase